MLTNYGTLILTLLSILVTTGPGRLTGPVEQARCAEPVAWIPLPGEMERSGNLSLSMSGEFLAASDLPFPPPESSVSVWRVSSQQRVAQYSGRGLQARFLRRREGFAVKFIDRIEFYSSQDWVNPERVILNRDFGSGVEWRGFELSPDDSRAAVFTPRDTPGGAKLLVLDLRNGEVVASFDHRAYPAWRTALGPGGEVLAMAGPEVDTIEIWDVKSKTRLRVLQSRPREDLPNLEREIEKLSFSPDGKLVASVHLDGSVRIYDLLPGSEPEIIQFGLSDWKRTLAFAPDGAILAILAGSPPGEPLFAEGYRNRMLSIWRTDGTGFSCRQQGWFWPASELAFSGDGRFLAAKEAFTVGRALVRRRLSPDPFNIQWFYVVYETVDLNDGPKPSPNRP